MPATGATVCTRGVAGHGPGLKEGEEAWAERPLSILRRRSSHLCTDLYASLPQMLNALMTDDQIARGQHEPRRGRAEALRRGIPKLLREEGDTLCAEVSLLPLGE